MEVWPVPAYGTADPLPEILTFKSGAVQGRTRIYESILRRADWDFARVGDGHRRGVSAGQPAPVKEVATPLMDKLEAALPQEASHLDGGERPEFRHGSVEGAERCRPAHPAFDYH